MLESVWGWLSTAAWVVDGIPMPQDYEDYKPVIFLGLLFGFYMLMWYLFFKFVSWCFWTFIYFFLHWFKSRNFFDDRQV